mgnify:CR=1 FL=1
MLKFIFVTLDLNEYSDFFFILSIIYGKYVTNLENIKWVNKTFEDFAWIDPVSVCHQ